MDMMINRISKLIGSLTSATRGAIIVAILAARLHIPKAVAFKIVGKRRITARYARQNACATPNLVIKSIIGIQSSL